MKKILWFIDPGHGGHDPGAIGPVGTKESWAALDVSLRIEEYLVDVPGIEVQLSRSDNDTFHSLHRRCVLANEAEADIFTSIHFNSASSLTATGHEVFTSPGQTAADPLATAQFYSVVARFPDLPSRPGLGDGDPDKEASFTVLRGTNMPATLYECGFISNAQEEQNILDPSWRQAMAEAIADGTLIHLGLKHPGHKPSTARTKNDIVRDISKQMAVIDKAQNAINSLTKELKEFDA